MTFNARHGSRWKLQDNFSRVFEEEGSRFVSRSIAIRGHGKGFYKAYVHACEPIVIWIDPIWEVVVTAWKLQYDCTP